MSTVVDLVRHAEAGNRARWDGADQQRPLTAEGWRQAEALAATLGVEPVDALYTSPFRRCVQTLEPLAATAGLAISPAEALAETPLAPVHADGDHAVALAWLAGRALGWLETVLAAHPRGRVVACSHGDVIPAFVAGLVGRDRGEVGAVHCPKGGWFRLWFDAGRCVALTRHDPPPHSTSAKRSPMRL